jgi:hypothetical protein
LARHHRANNGTRKIGPQAKEEINSRRHGARS